MTTENWTVRINSSSIREVKSFMTLLYIVVGIAIGIGLYSYIFHMRARKKFEVLGVNSKGKRTIADVKLLQQKGEPLLALKVFREINPGMDLKTAKVEIQKT